MSSRTISIYAYKDNDTGAWIKAKPEEAVKLQRDVQEETKVHENIFSTFFNKEALLLAPTPQLY